MPYEAEIVFHQGAENESWEEGVFMTLKEAVGFIEHWASGRPINRAWINHKEIPMRGCFALGKDGASFCTNEYFHEIFADEDYPRILPKQFNERILDKWNIATAKEWGIL